MNENNKHVVGGLLVMFEGVDGSGKTTQIQLVEKKLGEQGWPVMTRRSPGGTPIGEALRSVMLSPGARPPTTDLYIAMAMQEALLESTDPERQSGSVLLLDRSPLSIAAYQIYGGGIDETSGWSYVDGYMRRWRPDLVIMYDCEAKEALARAQQKSSHKDYFESMSLGYFERVIQGYHAAAKRYDSVIIDANQSIEAIHVQTMQYIDQAIAQRS
jgi:dTMP kinase